MPWLGYAAESPAPAEKKIAPKENPRGGAVSSHITDAIRARLPVFKPVPPPTPAPATEAGAGDAPVVLEKIVVTEQKVPAMGEFQMLTKAGQAAYLQKQFPGAVVPAPDPLTETVPNYAALMLRDKRRQEALDRWSEAVTALRATGDTAGGKRLTEEMQRALIRTRDWRDERLDRAFNNDRR